MSDATSQRPPFPQDKPHGDHYYFIAESRPWRIWVSPTWGNVCIEFEDGKTHYLTYRDAKEFARQLNAAVRPG